MVGDGTKSQDSSFLLVLVVALKHLSKIVLNLAEDDIRVVLRKLLEGEGAGFAERRIVILLAL